MRIARLFAVVLSILVALSVVAYYTLPCPAPGVTHFQRADGSWHRPFWVQAAAPFYVTGRLIIWSARIDLPKKRCSA